MEDDSTMFSYEHSLKQTKAPKYFYSKDYKMDYYKGEIRTLKFFRQDEKTPYQVGHY